LLALAALAPADAQAKLDLAPPPPTGRPAEPARVVSRAPRGFDWSDAGIGAAAGIGVSALAVGGGLVLVGRRHAAAHPVR